MINWWIFYPAPFLILSVLSPPVLKSNKAKKPRGAKLTTLINSGGGASGAPHEVALLSLVGNSETSALLSESVSRCHGTLVFTGVCSYFLGLLRIYVKCLHESVG